jgi:hypothetical protein
MVDVLDARAVRRKQGDRVMDLVDAQQRRIADPVAHAGVADFGPEGFVAGRVGRAQSDVAEPCDPGVPCTEITFSRAMRPAARRRRSGRTAGATACVQRSKIKQVVVP